MAYASGKLHLNLTAITLLKRVNTGNNGYQGTRARREVKLEFNEKKKEQVGEVQLIKATGISSIVLLISCKYLKISWGELESCTCLQCNFSGITTEKRQQISPGGGA